jgi:hypothetical protein
MHFSLQFVAFLSAIIREKHHYILPPSHRKRGNLHIRVNNGTFSALQTHCGMISQFLIKKSLTPFQTDMMS